MRDLNTVQRRIPGLQVAVDSKAWAQDMRSKIQMIHSYSDFLPNGQTWVERSHPQRKSFHVNCIP